MQGRDKAHIKKHPMSTKRQAAMPWKNTKEFCAPDW